MNRSKCCSGSWLNGMWLICFWWRGIVPRAILVGGIAFGGMMGCKTETSEKAVESPSETTEGKIQASASTTPESPDPVTAAPEASAVSPETPPPLAKDSSPEHACTPSGKEVLHGKFDGGPKGFSTGIDGELTYAPSAIMLSNGDKTLSILDVGRLLHFSVTGDKLQRTATTKMDGFPPNAAAIIRSGGHAAYHFFRSRLHTYDAQGKLLSDEGVSIAGLDESHSFGRQPALIAQKDGLWISNGDQLSRVADVQGKLLAASEFKKGAMLREGRTLNVSPIIHSGNPKTHVLTVSVGPSGAPPQKSVRIEYKLPVKTWLTPELGPKGEVFLLTSHHWREDGVSYSSELTRLTILSPDLEITHRLDLPPHPADFRRSRPLAVAADGSFYYLGLGPSEVFVTHYRFDAEGRLQCLSNPEALLPTTPSQDWSKAKVTKIRHGEELGCEARRTSGWLRVVCKKQSEFPGYISGLNVFGDVGQIVTRTSNHGRSVRTVRGIHGYSTTKGVEPQIELLVPFTRGTRLKGYGAWEKAYRTLELVWGEDEADPEYVGRFTPTIPPGAKESCKRMQSRFEKLAKKEKLSPAQRAAFPEGLHTCLLGAGGAWVLSVEAIRSEEHQGKPYLDVGFVVSAINSGGERSMMGQNRLEFTPGQLSLKQGALDLNQDKQIDAFMILSVKEGPGSPGMSLLWTKDGHAQEMLATSWFFHDVKRVDGDALPDLLTHGPFWTDLPEKCGTRKCPPTLAGPEFLVHNTGKGFSFKDAAARAYLKKSCSKRPQGALESAAHDVVCRRVKRSLPGALRDYLAAQRKEQCLDPAHCPAFDTLDKWSRKSLPN